MPSKLKVQYQLALFFSCLYLHGHFSGIFLVLFCYYCILWQEASIWITHRNSLLHERVLHLRPWTLSKGNLSLNVTKLQLCSRKINALPRMNQAKYVWPRKTQVLNGQNVPMLLSIYCCCLSPQKPHCLSF